MNPVSQPENGPQERPDRLKEYAGLLYDVASLITEIEADQENGEHTDHTFTFEVFGEHQIEIPKEVSDLMPTIDRIAVTLSKDAGASRPSVSLSIEFMSDDALLAISRSHDGETEYESDTFFDTSYHYRPGGSDQGSHAPVDARAQINTENHEAFQARLSSVDKIPTAKINTLIMSLIYPDRERGYKMFADADFLSPQAFNSLIDSFNLSTLDKVNSLGHKFTSSDALFTYYKQNDEHFSFNLQYPEKETERTIIAKSNMETDFRIEFTTHEDTQGDPFTMGGTLPRVAPYYPTTDELYYLRTILKTEIAALNPNSIEFSEDELSGGIDPEQRMIESNKIILSKRHVRDVLEKLGFDPPNAGA